MIKKFAPLIILVTSIAAAAAIRIRLLGIPLERDEGEYAYIASQLLHGVPPYIKAYSMKFAGIYVVYAGIISAFGHSVAGIHLGLTVINAATAAILFLVGRRIFDSYVGAVAGAAFSVLSLGKGVLGLAANSEHFVIFYIVAGLYVLTGALRSRGPVRYIISGVLFGIAFIIKQHALSFVIFALLYIIIYRIRSKGPARIDWVRDWSCFVLSCAMPFAIMCAALAFTGSLPNFIFWAIIYPRHYIAIISSIWQGLYIFIIKFVPIFMEAPLMWILAAGGMIGVAAERMAGEKRFLTILFGIFSLLSTTFGLMFREHYFMLIIPAAAIFAGIAVREWHRILCVHANRKIMPAFIMPGIFLAAAFLPIFAGKEIFFKMSPSAASRAIYGLNPFPEAVKISEYIAGEIKEGQTVAVLGSEPEIYFYLKRPGAIPYIYMYPLMEEHPYFKTMQEEMMAMLKDSRPDYLIYFQTKISWFEFPISREHGSLFYLLKEYCDSYYNVIGVVDLIHQNDVRYVWGGPAIAYAPSSKNCCIFIYRKKELPRLEFS